MEDKESMVGDPRSIKRYLEYLDNAYSARAEGLLSYNDIAVLTASFHLLVFDEFRDCRPSTISRMSKIPKSTASASFKRILNAKLIIENEIGLYKLNENAHINGINRKGGNR